MAKPSGNLEFLNRYAGKKPPAIGYDPGLAPEGYAIVGYIAVQWAALMAEIEWKIEFSSHDPQVPEPVRAEQPRREAKHQIAHLRKVATHLYSDKRSEAINEFESIMGNITRLKGTRDALVHGRFSKRENTDPRKIIVHHNGRKVAFSYNRLTKVGVEIGQVHSALIEFDQWADYERLKSFFQTLLEQSPEH